MAAGMPGHVQPTNTTMAKEKCFFVVLVVSSKNYQPLSQFVPSYKVVFRSRLFARPAFAACRKHYTHRRPVGFTFTPRP